MSKLTLGLVAAMALSLSATAFADDCGKNDRVPLPACVDHRIDGKHIIINRCAHDITIKVDQSGRDHLETISPSLWDNIIDEAKISTRTRVMCCPRYNSCENIRSPSFPE